MLTSNLYFVIIANISLITSITSNNTESIITPNCVTTIINTSSIIVNNSYFLTVNSNSKFTIINPNSTVFSSIHFNREIKLSTNNNISRSINDHTSRYSDTFNVSAVLCVVIIVVFECSRDGYCFV